MILKHYKLNEHEEKLLNMSNEEFDNYMMLNYPEMFKQRRRTKDQKIILPMNFGFCIGRGWRHVLDTLCKKLQTIQNSTGLICVFDQIKEKFGGGRFYFHIEHKEDEKIDKDNMWFQIIHDMVNMAESYTDYVCEELGTNYSEKDKVVYPNWVYGMSLSGFKQYVSREFDKESEHRIKLAEEFTDKYRLISRIKDKMYYVNDVSDIKSIEKYINEILEKNKMFQKENIAVEENV